MRATGLWCVLTLACTGTVTPHDAGIDARAIEDAALDAASVDAPISLDAGPPVDPLEGIGDVELVDDGYEFLEGPQWRAAEGDLVFSDIPANTIYRLEEPSTVTVHRSPSDNSNGLAIDRNGALLAAEHGTRRVSRTLADGSRETVADVYQGMRLNSPNDLVVASDGSIYFTDPPWGIDVSQRELGFNGVFHVSPAGVLTALLEWPTSENPNGIALSPDERTLYVTNDQGSAVRAYDLLSPSAVDGERDLFAANGADGVAVDRAGNVYVAASTGIEVFAPDGRGWGAISIPEQPANCAFGGADARTLYVTARTGLYRVRLRGEGIY